MPTPSCRPTITRELKEVEGPLDALPHAFSLRQNRAAAQLSVNFFAAVPLAIPLSTLRPLSPTYSRARLPPLYSC